MQSKLNSKLILVSACLLAILISGCLFGQAAVVSTDTPSTSPTESPSTEAPSPTMLPAPIDSLEVVFVNNGNLLVWDAATQQTRTIVNTGDVFSATVSDDGQAIAFTRRSWVGDGLEGYEQYALWTVDRVGGNPRELVSAQDLRQRVSPAIGSLPTFISLAGFRIRINSFSVERNTSFRRKVFRTPFRKELTWLTRIVVRFPCWLMPGKPALFTISRRQASCSHVTKLLRFHKY